MSESEENQTPILLTETEAAKLLGFARKTLQGWRTRGHVELPFVRISRGCVRYRRIDIDAWIERQLRTSTSDDAARGLVLRERKKDRQDIPQEDIRQTEVTDEPDGQREDG